MNSNKYIYLLTIIVFSTIISSCKNTSDDNKIYLTVSIPPQKYLLDKLILNDKIVVNVAIPSGANPETYDPSPSKMVTIGRSSMYFKIGNFNFENTWLKNIIVNNSSMKIVDCSKDIPQITNDDHHGVDPHIWSSPKNLSIMANTMAHSLSQLYDSKEFYLKNKTLQKQIEQTDSIIQSCLNKSKNKSFIIYHPALSYFANEYNLKQYSIEIDGKSPSPTHIASLIETGKKENIKVIFIQKEYDIKNVKNIAKELGAKIVTIDPLTYQWDDELIKIAKAIANENE